MTTATLAGSTGFVGSHILSTLLTHPSISAVYAYARRDVPNPTASPKLFPLTSTDTSTWASQFPRELHPRVFFSALGTTRSAAGSVEAQRKIDVDLNLELAKAAKDAGVETYVLISSGGANASGSFPYLKMKGELEERVKELGFKHTVILRPGMILGSRPESRPVEAVVRGFAGALRKISPALTNFWGQEASTIARAAVQAGVMCLEGKREDGVWMVTQAEIVKLGTEEKK
ncbi:NAD dependent epimerase/dehydratase family protein-like protein [Trematosphaeria pertusa]|uniref:NAD dependent epimerase/dehydratase family protein-like protein n=1 Tax=Trematosphaeria pertusa TaxID=390896 RepID=A0A6A6IIV5_9PLEO|nr:NAD dependent epimerase/dehydratase family protein-like protein [Trematosphaeria pertusa]KAF2250341.1 NAD dependent epimerase/dehydratase family protein-like protein [Trematosphaeria pertusa]